MIMNFNRIQPVSSKTFPFEKGNIYNRFSLLFGHPKHCCLLAHTKIRANTIFDESDLLKENYDRSGNLEM